MIGDRDGASAAEPDIAALFAQLRGDAERVARAEVAVRRAQIAHKATIAKQVAIFGAAAGVIAFAALVALLVGLILSLAAIMSAFWATLIVVIAALAVAAMLGMTAKRHIARLGAPS